MPKIFTSKTQKFGEIGEGIACNFLIKKRFVVIERNYTKPWGEIDIVAKKDKKLHFIEVKTVSCEIINGKVTHPPARAGETKGIRPEENMHRKKLDRLSRVVETYLLKCSNDEVEWQFDLISVLLDVEKKIARVRILEDIVF